MSKARKTTNHNDKPETVRVVILAGTTWRGTKYFEDTRYDVSPDYAKVLVEQGIARLWVAGN